MARQQKGLEPDVFTGSAAISACEKGKQPDKALGRPDDMQWKGLQPGVLTNSAAINAGEMGKQRQRPGTWLSICNAAISAGREEQAASQGLGAPSGPAAKRPGASHVPRQRSFQRMREGQAAAQGL